MNKKKAGIITGAAAAAAAIILWVFVFNGKGDETGDTASAGLQGVEVSAGSVAIKVEGPSVAEPFRTQIIRSAIDGTLIYADEEGDEVEKGEVIAELDRTDSLILLKQAEINLDKAKLTKEKDERQLRIAEDDLEGKKKLLKSGAVSQEQVDEARAAADIARYTLEASKLDMAQAELALEVARKNLEDTKIEAPFSGIIISSDLLPGDMVNKGTELVTIADISKIRLNAEIDEFDIGKVKPGQSVSITSDALGGKVLTSTVYSISPSADIVNNISIFKVTTIIDNEDNAIKPGMSADISILIKSDTGIIVPSKAVSKIRTRSYIKVYEDGEVKTRKVKTGADNGINTVVLSGLEEGDIVVVEQAQGFSLTTGTDSTGSSVIPITIPGVRK